MTPEQEQAYFQEQKIAKAKMGKQLAQQNARIETDNRQFKAKEMLALAQAEVHALAHAETHKRVEKAKAAASAIAQEIRHRQAETAKRLAQWAQNASKMRT